jgi:hypothetical protein
MSGSRLRRLILGVALIAALPIIAPAAATAGAPSPRHVASCPSPDSANYASISPDRIWDEVSYGGSASCNSWVDVIQIKCWVVHRHTLWWHSHSETTRDETVFAGPRVVLPIGGRAVGNNGNKYKTHCDMSARHGNSWSWSRESATVTL